MFVCHVAILLTFSGRRYLLSFAHGPAMSPGSKEGSWSFPCTFVRSVPPWGKMVKVARVMRRQCVVVNKLKSYPLKVGLMVSA